VRVSGPHFGALGCDGSPEEVSVNSAGELTSCVVAVKVPVISRGGAGEQPRLVIEFRLDEGTWEPVVVAS
jgi:hypothetical protein